MDECVTTLSHCHSSPLCVFALCFNETHVGPTPSRSRACNRQHRVGRIFFKEGSTCWMHPQRRHVPLANTPVQYAGLYVRVERDWKGLWCPPVGGVTTTPSRRPAAAVARERTGKKGRTERALVVHVIAFSLSAELFHFLPRIRFGVGVGVGGSGGGGGGTFKSK